MKRGWLLLGWILTCTGVYGQTDDDFEKYAREQEAAFNEYVRTEEERFKAYNDSINREFGRYLAEVWPDYPLTKKEPPIKNPIPPDTYVPGDPRPDPMRYPVRGEIEPPALPVPPTHDDRRKLTPVPMEVPKLKADFYGTTVTLRRTSYALPPLNGVDEKSGIITSCGAVGIIDAVGRHYSYALSFKNSGVSISARIGKEGSVGPMRWDGHSDRGAILSEIPHHITLTPGDTVYTSGYSTIFPPDIPLGTIGDARIVNGATYEIEVSLLEDFNSLRYVTIVSHIYSEELKRLEEGK